MTDGRFIGMPNLYIYMHTADLQNVMKIFFLVFHLCDFDTPRYKYKKDVK